MRSTPDSPEPYPTTDALLLVLGALDSQPRLRILERLAQGRQYVSELAREISLSRPLVHMHLKRLEDAGLIRGHLELSTDGKAVKYYQIEAFDLRLTPEIICNTLKKPRSNPDKPRR